MLDDYFTNYLRSLLLTDKYRERTRNEFPMHRSALRATEFLLSISFTACYRAKSGMPYFFRIEPFKWFFIFIKILKLLFIFLYGRVQAYFCGVVILAIYLYKILCDINKRNVLIENTIIVFCIILILISFHLRMQKHNLYTNFSFLSVFLSSFILWFK